MGNCFSFFDDMDIEWQVTEQGRQPPQMTEQWDVAELIKLRQRLPREAYNLEMDGDEEVSECAICLTDLTCGDLIRRLWCKHVYHADCIDVWLMSSFTCPYCRDPVDKERPAT